MRDANMFGEYSGHILIHRSRFFFQDYTILLQKSMEVFAPVLPFLEDFPPVQFSSVQFRDGHVQ